VEHAGYERARERMVRRQLARRGIRDRRVLDAMRRVPRERFVPADLREHAYEDRALPIDEGQTISQPYIVALMTQALEMTGVEKVLEVGTGSGYQTAVLSHLARRVVSIERHQALSDQAAARLTELDYAGIELVVGDGSLGWPAQAPYDRILVTAAVDHVPPALLEQLVDGGILVAPIGPPSGQVLQAIDKTAGQVQVRALVECRFVPLIESSE
jgi:protein-L-isoaspartate(D-aspartate) O-methyltransferase